MAILVIKTEIRFQRTVVRKMKKNNVQLLKNSVGESPRRGRLEKAGFNEKKFFFRKNDEMI